MTNSQIISNSDILKLQTIAADGSRIYVNGYMDAPCNVLVQHADGGIIVGKMGIGIDGVGAIGETFTDATLAISHLCKL